MNWLSALLRIALVACLLLTGCNYEERLGKLEKQNRDLQAEVKKERAVAEYDMQAKCAKDSKLWFGENWPSDKDTLLLTYTNHYNRSLNKCFIEVEYHHTVYDGSWANSITVWDVYENEKYGTVSVTHKVSLKPEYHDNENVLECEVYGKKCKSWNEFNGLANPYLSN